jgi:hypothetical protein
VSRSVTGSRAASVATLCGQPAILPLRLNSQRPVPNGAQAVSITGIPGVAARTAASTALLRTSRATAANDGSFHIGIARRYRLGVVVPSAYQPAPNPSAFAVPLPRMSAGAKLCRSSECGGSSSSVARSRCGPR